MKQYEIKEKQKQCDDVIQYINNNCWDGLQFVSDEVALILDALKNYKGVLEQQMPINTEITYIHREPETNNKTWFTVVLNGQISGTQIKEIIENLQDIDWNFFYPDMVGLPFKNKDEVHELHFSSIIHVNKPATIPMTVDELVSNFKQAKEKNWGTEDVSLEM